MTRPLITQQFRTSALVWIGFVVLTFGMDAHAESVPQDKNTGHAAGTRLAVLGFADRRMTTADDQAHAAGLADLLAFSLSEEGVALIDRQSIGGSLSERRLRRLIGDPPDAGPSGPLPGADLLVRGEVADGPGLGLLVTVEARRADDGSLVHRVQLAADTDEQLTGVVRLAAQRLAPVVRGGSNFRPGPGRRVAGFTENPEAALMFYRGLEELTQGRTTLAIACFDQAIRLDWHFLTARVWLYHALNRAGLPDFAKASVEGYTPSRQEELRKRIAAVGSLLNADELVVSTVAEPSAEGVARRLESRWSADARLRVLSAEGLADSRDEQDLRLSGEFEHLPRVIDRWLFCDVLIRVSQDTVRVFDLQSGRELGAAPLEQAADPGWVLETASRAGVDRRGSRAAATPVVARKRATVDADGVNLHEAAMPRGEAARFTGSGGDRVRLTAYVLDRALREPENLSAWHAVSELYRFWSRRPGLDRMVALIDSNRQLPNAAAWLSDIGNSRFEWDFHNPRRAPLLAAETEPTVAERYPELLAWFPQSMSAEAVRITMAFEHAAMGRDAEAIGALREIARRAPDYKWPGNVSRIGDNVEPNVYFELARLLTRAGEFREARYWFARCLKQDLNKPVKVFNRVIVHAYKDRVRFWTDIYGGVSHLDTLQQRRRDFEDLRPQVRELGVYLNRVERGEDLGPFRGFVDLYLASFDEPDPRRRFGLQADSVAAWLAQREADYAGGGGDRHAIPPRVLQQLAWLRVFAADESEHQRVEAMLERLLADLPTQPSQGQNVWQGFKIETLMLLAGREAEVQARITAGLNPLDVKGGLSPLYRQVALDSLRFEPGEATKRLESLLDRHHAALLAGSVDRDFSYPNLIEQVAPVLMERGRFARAAGLYRHITDDPRVPWVFRGRALAERAVAEARLGRPEAAASMLTGVLEQTVSRSPTRENTGAVRPAGAGGRAYRKRYPDDPAALGSRVNDHLRRLRLFQGRGQTAAFDVATIRFTPLAEDSRTRGKLHAFAYLLSQKSAFHDYMGTTFWPDEASRALGAMGPDAKPYLERLLWSVTLTDGQTFEPNRQASWFALSVASQLGPDHGLARRWLLDRLSWSPICEIKLHATRALMAAGHADPHTVSTLAVASAMFDGCEHSARRALRQLGSLEPASAQALTDLLDHPVQDARRHAASALHRHFGIDLPQEDGLPDDRAVARLKQWLDRTGREQPPPPASDVRLRLTHAAFDHAGQHWIAAGSGPAVWAGTVNHPQAAILLDHTPADWISVASLSADGSTVATYAQDHVVRVWKTATPSQPVLTLPVETWVNQVTLDDTGDRLVFTIGGGRVVVVDVASGRTIHSIETHRDGVSDVELLQEPGRIVTATGPDAALTTIDLATGRWHSRGFGTAEVFRLIRRLDDGRLLTCSYDQTVRVWTPGAAWASVRLNGLFRNPFAAAPSPDGDRIVTQDAHGRLGVWDSHTGQRLATHPKVEPWVYNIAWPAGSGPVLILQDGSLMRWSQDFEKVETIRLPLFEQPKTPEVDADDC